MLFFTRPFKENQGVATHDVWPLVPNFRDRGVITPFQQNKRGYGGFFFFLTVTVNRLKIGLVFLCK